VGNGRDKEEDNKQFFCTKRFFEESGMKSFVPHICRFFSTANPTWGVIFESSKLKARTSLLPRFSEKRRSSFEL